LSISFEGLDIHSGGKGRDKYRKMEETARPFLPFHNCLFFGNVPNNLGYF